MWREEDELEQNFLTYFVACALLGPKLRKGGRREERAVYFGEDKTATISETRSSNGRTSGWGERREATDLAPESTTPVVNTRFTPRVVSFPRCCIDAVVALRRECVLALAWLNGRLLPVRTLELNSPPWLSRLCVAVTASPQQVQ